MHVRPHGNLMFRRFLDVDQRVTIGEGMFPAPPCVMARWHLFPTNFDVPGHRSPLMKMFSEDIPVTDVAECSRGVPRLSGGGVTKVMDLLRLLGDVMLGWKNTCQPKLTLFFCFVCHFSNTTEAEVGF